ncbi:MAG: MmcB family DNA repair protein [Labrys sp. (in: a-proteobacteria)]|jgi:hypothetical protein
MHLVEDGRQSPQAQAIQRGAGRVLRAYGFAPVPELPLPTGRRADLAALDPKGTVWIVEIKSSLADFRADQKWMEYRASCDALFFAVAPEFPVEILPPDTGLIIADAYGGSIARPAPEHRLAAPARKAMTLSIARAAAARLHAAMDPDAGWALG